MLNLIEPFDLAFLSSLSTGRRMIFRFPFSIREKLFSPSREDFIFFSSFTSNRARVSSFNLKTKGRKDSLLGKLVVEIVGPRSLGHKLVPGGEISGETTKDSHSAARRIVNFFCRCKFLFTPFSCLSLLLLIKLSYHVRSFHDLTTSLFF